MNIKKEFIEINKMLKWLTVITVIIVLLNILNEILRQPSWQITRLISVGLESNFPTWFSSLLLAIAAFWAYKCSLIAKSPHQGKSMWQLLSLGLIAMSCDETAMIHENLGKVINKYFFKLESIKHSAWTITLGPVILLIIFIFALKIRKYLDGSTKARRLLILGAFIFIFGAFFLEGTINFLNHEKMEFVWQIENIFEEACEMFGTITIIWGLIEHYKFLLSRPDTVLEKQN